MSVAVRPNNGFMIIDKPSGMTSHDVTAQLRKRLKIKRIGHSGTLDPGATGVLIVGLGHTCRLLQYLSDLPKTYTFDLCLGIETDTLDDQGQTTAVHDMSKIKMQDVAAKAQFLLGPSLQTSPQVSAR